MTNVTSVDQREMARLRCIDSLFIDGTAPEPQFDEIARLACGFFNMPIALVSIVGRNRQWLKARIGLDVAETPRDVSFCSIAITLPNLLVVPDATKDIRFQHNPLVTGAPFIRFYAGAPLETSDGFRIGALCLIDTKPRPPLSQEEQRNLATLANICVGEVERRRLLVQTVAAKGFAEAASDVVLFCTPDGIVTYVNRAAEALLGFTPEELVGCNLSSFIPERFVAGHKAGMARLTSSLTSKLGGRTLEAIVRRKDGREVPIDLALKMWRDESGINVGATMIDITERKSRELKLQHLAQIDALTGLLRANAFTEVLSNKIKADGQLVLLLIDLNGFKSINDSLGHAAGDALLKALSMRLLSIVDPTSIVGRLGGDEFAVLLSNAYDPLMAEDYAGQIQAAFNEPFDVSGHKLFVGVSIGCAMAPRDATESSDLIVAADLALYKAKTFRGKPFLRFEQSMRDEASAKRILHDRVRLGLERGEFVMQYQPQVLLDGVRVVAAEALMRWRHPEQGLLFPSTFLPAMENTSLALSAGYWSIEQACRQLARWIAEQKPVVRMCVNIFAAQLRHGDIIATLTDLLEKYCLPPHLLEIEITENIAGQDDDDVVATLSRIRQLGVGIALDDFGTGYASLRTLKYVPATTVKIDKSFVSDLINLKEDAAIISAIMHVARSLNLRVVAEGIETKEQEVYLRVMGCHIGQCYLYGRAVDGDAFHHAAAA